VLLKGLRKIGKLKQDVELWRVVEYTSSIPGGREGAPEIARSVRLCAEELSAETLLHYIMAVLTKLYFAAQRIGS
jgi:hypothetical protein